MSGKEQRQFEAQMSQARSNPLRFSPIAVREYDLTKLMLGNSTEQKVERAKRDGMSDDDIQAMYSQMARLK